MESSESITDPLDLSHPSDEESHAECADEGYETCVLVSPKVEDSLQNTHPVEPKIKKYGDKYSCKLCKYTCRRLAYFQKHMETHSTADQHCNQCDFVTNSVRILKAHLKAHRVGERPFVCQYCGVGFSRSNHLKDHLKIHTGNKPYTCAFCNFSASTSGNLKVHVRIHTGEKPYACTICDFRAVQKGHLNDHLRKHTGEKPFKCDFCEYTAATGGNMNVHMRTHTRETPYKCNECDYTSSHSGLLKIHMRIHTGEDLKPFACEYCDYKASRRQTLKTHLKTHTDLKYACNRCDFITGRAGQLSKHMRIHRGNPPRRSRRINPPSELKEKPKSNFKFTCSSCGYVAISEPDLILHTITHTRKNTLTCGVAVDQKPTAILHDDRPSSDTDGPNVEVDIEPRVNCEVIQFFDPERENPIARDPVYG